MNAPDPDFWQKAADLRDLHGVDAAVQMADHARSQGWRVPVEFAWAEEASALLPELSRDLSTELDNLRGAAAAIRAQRRAL